MKYLSKILLLAVFLSLFNCSFATAKDELPIAADAKPIDIIYIHGAYETRDAFNNSVRNVHDDMVKQFQNDPFMYKNLLDNGNKKIGEKEIIFFWADQTEENQKILDKALAYVKNVGSFISRFGRETLSHLLHDAIWISKPVNYTPLLNDLLKVVKEEYSKGNEVILYGYSAGSLLASEYLTQKMPIIDLNEIKNAADDDSYMNRYFAQTVKKHKFKPTCLDALKESKLVFYTDNDEFVANPDISFLKREFPNLDTYTDKYCSPQGALKGIVVFGAPLTIFDSSAPKEGSSSNQLMQLAMKYLVENNVFFLVVNYENDFIGMPLAGKPTLNDLQNSQNLGDVTPNGGFLYDATGVKCWTNVFSSHMAYWSNGKRFAKSIVKAYNDGYKYFYSIPDTTEK